MTFEEAKKEYVTQRLLQKKKIISDVLKPLGFSADMRGGKGMKHYTSKGNIPEFDLSYWMWIDAEKEGKGIFTVYLQSFDRDPDSGNYHVLMDRLSIQWEGDDRIIPLNIDLPMDSEKENILKQVICSHAKKGNETCGFINQ